MMTSNNALVPDPDKQDDLASQFWQWPILAVGLRMCGWDDSIVKYFLLGNPLVYWGSTASLGVIALLVAWYLVRWQRGYDELKQSDIDQIHYGALYPVLGWFLHYMPFTTTTRLSTSPSYLSDSLRTGCSEPRSRVSNILFMASCMPRLLVSTSSSYLFHGEWLDQTGNIAI
jgi:hypothetical protein